MSVFGNIVVSLSWFGVNMLGVGLHSYGFMDRAFGNLMTFIAGQLVIMALGIIPIGGHPSPGETTLRALGNAVTSAQRSGEGRIGKQGQQAVSPRETGLYCK